MAYKKYQGYQYETSPRKVEPEYEPIKIDFIGKKNSTANKKANNKQSKKQAKSRTKMVVAIAFTFSILFAIIYQNSLITESFSKKESLKKNLGAIEKENEQLKVNIEKSLNLNNVEQSAKEMLGMQKLDNSQKIYINLPKEDYVESATEEVVIEEDTSFWEKLLKGISNIFK